MPSSRRTFCKTIGLSTIIPSVVFLDKPNQALAQSPDDFLAHLGNVSPGSDAYWKLVRDQFPLTRERAFFNTGGLGASPYQVIQAVKKKMDELEELSEVGRSERVWSDIKSTVAGFIDCNIEEITLTGCCTEGMNIAANAIPLGEGDEVLTTTHEHVGGALPWLGRQKRDGIVVKTFEPGNSAGETLDRLKQKITKKTKAISVSQITCTTGAILPVREISDYARQHEIWSVIDGAQAIGHMPVSMKEIGCDCYATSGHKWLLGPKRTGLLFIRKDRISEMLPVTVGAYSDDGWDFTEGVTFHPTAQRFEYGTYNVPIMVGLQRAVEFLTGIGMRNIFGYTQNLTHSFISAINNIKNIELLSPPQEADRSSMVTIRPKNMRNTELQSFLATDYRLRTRIVPEAGLDGLRISLHLYNTPEEIMRLIEGVTAGSQKK